MSGPLSRTLSPRKKQETFEATEDSWRSDNPLGPSQVDRSVPSGMQRIRNTLAKLLPSSQTEKELLRKKNQCKSPLTHRNIDTLKTEQECNEVFQPNLHSPEVQVTEWLRGVS
ncbi:hypothetical protein N7535_003970 [Penicillium sp. DV-2018c]|nr:hypothetical protein N7461_000330 [Penicillium sp. DV-2018c]KAJ5577044.1 hypothetical protein N7535_003970 [Penicillium sp. DV-2018c]